MIRDGKYDFETVFCTGDGLFRKPTTPSPPKNMDIIPLLLKDVNSVDVCFTFTSDTVYSNVGLWAHRIVLARQRSLPSCFNNRMSSSPLSRLPPRPITRRSTIRRPRSSRIPSQLVPFLLMVVLPLRPTLPRAIPSRW